MNVLLLLPLFSTLLLLPCCTTAPSFDAIYQFGDSISDTGNDVREPSNPSCRTPPYGGTFFRHPTGRCSDGLLMVDYFAQAFKLPFISAYLDKWGDFSHGANFAVAGATALNTSVGFTESSLLVQLRWFKTHLATLCSNSHECRQKLGNALFVVGEIGGNDYDGRAFFGHETPTRLRSLVPDVVQVIISVVKEVIDAGAKHIMVPGNFPVGCMTIYLATYRSPDPAAYDELGCLKDWNDLAADHNDQLQAALNSIQQQHPDVAIAYGDYYNALRSLFQLLLSIGFDKAALQQACCGSSGGDYNFDGAHLCGSDGVTVCPDPSVRVSWDGIHLTQHAYQFMAEQLLKQIR